MTTVLDNPQSVRKALEGLQVLVEQLSASFVGGIHTPADYKRATVLLDELTDGHTLNTYEERVLTELEDAILAYESNSQPFAAINAEIKAANTPIQLLRDFMEMLGLTGSDLPEIGDKTAVSKVLSGARPISHKMAYALAQRFRTKPDAFIESRP
jgi:HTH-type transcriptional regulator/antitoxin HigA